MSLFEQCYSNGCKGLSAAIRDSGLAIMGVRGDLTIYLTHYSRGFVH